MMTISPTVAVSYKAAWRRKALFLLLIVLLLVGLILYAIAVGSYDLTIQDVCRTLCGMGEGPMRTVVWNIRLPRIVSAVIAGAGLAFADYYPLEWVRAQHLARERGRRGHLFIDKEKLLSWNPDIIFIDAWGFNVVRQDYQRRPDFYQGLKAVRESNTYILYPYNMYTTNIETVVADAYAVAKLLYPGIFADLVLAQRTDEIFSFFLKKPVYDRMKKNFGDLGGIVDFGRESK